MFIHTHTRRSKKDGLDVNTEKLISFITSLPKSRIHELRSDDNPAISEVSIGLVMSHPSGDVCGIMYDMLKVTI